MKLATSFRVKMSLPKLTGILVVLSMGLLLEGCATPVERANEKNDFLAAAGFQIVPVVSNEQRLQLQTLPPNRVVQKIKDGKVVFLYADPYACGCLYVGNQQAWDNYRREQLQQNFLDQERMNAEMNQNTSWNWGVWGPGWCSF